MTNQQKTNELGFSLIELIGVLAIIAILASLIAPRIFTSIEDAKVASVVQDAQRLKTVVTQYYKDTGLMPTHTPGTANVALISNGASVKGWKGPYIEEELKSPFETSTTYAISSGATSFDINGDGVADFSNASILVIDGLSVDQAQAISDAIDQDAAKTGLAAWYTGGKVRTRNSTQPNAATLGSQAAGSDLLIMLNGY